GCRVESQSWYHSELRRLPYVRSFQVVRLWVRMRADYCLDHIVAQSLCWPSMRGDENMWARALTNDVESLIRYQPVPSEEYWNVRIRQRTNRYCFWLGLLGRFVVASVTPNRGVMNSVVSAGRS